MKSFNKLQKLIQEMNADEIIEIFDIDVWSIANQDAQDMDDQARTSFIEDCANIINNRKK